MRRYGGDILAKYFSYVVINFCHILVNGLTTYNCKSIYYHCVVQILAISNYYAS